MDAKSENPKINSERTAQWARPNLVLTRAFFGGLGIKVVKVFSNDNVLLLTQIGCSAWRRELIVDNSFTFGSFTQFFMARN